MDLLILITYFSFCWLLFRIFNIPVNKWSMTTVILGAVIFLGTILSLVSYFHPASMSARSYFVTTPIAPVVKGRVIEVNVEPNKALSKGDILFKIDPIPFQAKVDQLTAEIKFAQKRLKQTSTLEKASAGSKFEVEKFEKELESLNAKLEEAQFNLDNTVVRAPTDGFVTHLRLRAGMLAVPFPIAPVMTFIHTDKPFFVGGFSQQPMQNVKIGNEAEVMFPGIPGRVFKAKVTNILDAIAEGQIAPAANMIKVNAQVPEGLIPVFIELEDDMSDFYLPMGSAATIAVYSEEFHHVSMVRRIILRMLSWTNYVRLH